MLITTGKNNKPFIISLPPKVGSRRFYIAKDEEGNLLGSKEGQHHGGYGALDKGDSLFLSYKPSERILIVREPLTRYISIFWFCCTTARSRFQKHSWSRNKDFKEFADWVVNADPNRTIRNIFTKPLSIWIDWLKTPNICPVENQTKLWKLLGPEWKEAYQRAKTHKNPNRKSNEETIKKKDIPVFFKDHLMQDYERLEKFYQIPDLLKSKKRV